MERVLGLNTPVATRLRLQQQFALQYNYLGAKTCYKLENLITKLKTELRGAAFGFFKS